jgi:hypothetical protein
MQNRIASAGTDGLRERSGQVSGTATRKVILHNATFT